MGRIEKVNQQLRREISYILQRELSDQRMVFVSITAVDVSPDLQHAKVFFSYLGPAGQVPAIELALARARGTIRHYVARNLQMRNTPDFSFIFDNSISTGERIQAALDEIRHEENS